MIHKYIYVIPAALKLVKSNLQSLKMQHINEKPNGGMMLLVYHCLPRCEPRSW